MTMTSGNVGEIIANYAHCDENGLHKYGIQGLIGQPRVFKYLARELAKKASDLDDTDFDLVAGNVIGGMVLGWQMREYIESSLGRKLPFVYVRGGFKKGGHGELEVGTRNNPLIKEGMNTLLVDIEEGAANHESRITSSVDGLSSAGYGTTCFATIAQHSPISGRDIQELYLVTVPELIEIVKSGETSELEPHEASLRKPDYKKANIKDIGFKIIDGGALEIRDVDGGEESFLYRSGNRGPGYLMIKGLVGQPEIMKYLVEQLALKVLERGYNVDAIAANATGGVIPGWQLREELELFTGREIPYVCVTGTRGNIDSVDPKELIIGMDTPLIKPGMNMLVIEELVNFAETTNVSAKLLRRAGFKVENAATLFSFDHDNQRQSLIDNNMELTHLINLENQLNIAEERFGSALVDSFREFRANPIEWQQKRGIEPPK